MQISKYENNGLYIELNRQGLHISYRYGEVLPYSNGSKNKTKEIHWYPFTKVISENSEEPRIGFFHVESREYDEQYFLKGYVGYWDILYSWIDKHKKQLTVDKLASGKLEPILSKITNGIHKEVGGKITKEEIYGDVNINVMINLISKRESENEDRNKSGGIEN